MVAGSDFSPDSISGSDIEDSTDEKIFHPGSNCNILVIRENEDTNSNGIPKCNTQQDEKLNNKTEHITPPEVPPLDLFSQESSLIESYDSLHEPSDIDLRSTGEHDVSVSFIDIPQMLDVCICNRIFKLNLWIAKIS